MKQPSSKHIVHFAAILTMLLWSTVAFAYQYTKLPTQSQLPVANIHCILQDCEGFFWYGTTGGGLCRDDGYSIAKFGVSAVSCIAEDRQGRIWFGADKMLCCIDKHSYRVDTVMQRGHVSALMCDRHGRLWIGADGGVSCIDPNTHHTLMHRKDFDELPAQIYEDSHGTVWVLFFTHKLWRCKSGTLNLQPFLTDTSLQPVRLCEDKKSGGYWLATFNGGVVYLDATHRTIIPQPVTATSSDQSKILDMVMDNVRNLLYVSANDNLYLYAINGHTLTDLSTSLPMSEGKKVLDRLCLDRQGHLWVSGFIPTTFILTPSYSSFKRDAITAMSKLTGFPLIADRAVASGNLLWISQGRVGLMIYNTSSHSLYDASRHPINSRLIVRRNGGGIWAAGNNTLWALTSTDGISVLSSEIGHFDQRIRFIGPSSHGQLLVGTNNGLFRMNASSTDLQRIYKSEQAVLRAVDDVDGRLFMLVDDGSLICRTADGHTVKLAPASFRITCLAIGSDGTLWTGSRKGRVYTLAPGAKALTEDQTLSNASGDAILDIAVDRLRHVWILSDQYVRECNAVTHAQRLLHSTHPQANVYNFYKLEQTEQGNIGIGAAGAYFELAPSAQLDAPTTSGNAPIVSAYIMGDSTYLAPQSLRTIEIPENISSVTIQCSTCSPIAASHIRFAYRVEGRGESWQTLPQGYNAIHLNNLPAGRLSIEVKATDEYGRWMDDSVLQITVNHTPHWWQTWWARLIFCLLILTLGIVLWTVTQRIHLLQRLQEMRHRLSLKEIELQTDDTEMPDKGEELLAKAIHLVEQHMSDADYNVQHLSSDMCMSRANLYRRITELTGHTVTEFMRDIRLKQAALLLRRHPDININKVHTSVGFTTSSYFTKCFKEKFGLTPSEYQRSMPKDEEKRRNYSHFSPT